MIVKTYQQEQHESAAGSARHACGLPHSSAEPTVNAICPDYLTGSEKPTTLLSRNQQLIFITEAA